MWQSWTYGLQCFGWSIPQLLELRKRDGGKDGSDVVKYMGFMHLDLDYDLGDSDVLV